jgi:DNA-binding NarL/FixJ family response regulator
LFFIDAAEREAGQLMIKVAVIEDDPVLLSRFCDAINATQDMSVVNTANSFAVGLGLIDAGGYDVLLSDLGLPDGDGTILIAKESAMGRDTDILVITQFADQKKVLDSIRAGARGYLLKDQRIESFIEAIAEIRRGGSPISPSIARQLINQMGVGVPAAQAPKLVSPLSERETEVLQILSRGFSYQECAGVLKVSANTIGFHVKNIYRKLEVNSRAEALFEATTQGLIPQYGSQPI